MNSCILRLLFIWISNNAESICRKESEKLRRSALHAFIKRCVTKSAQMARPSTLTDSYTRFLLKTQPFLNFVTRTTKSFSYIITLPKYTVLIHWWIVYANLLLRWSTHCFITLLSETPTKSHRWAIPNPNTLLRYTLSYYLAKQIPISIHCWAIPNPITLLRYTLSSYFAEQIPISIHWWAKPNPNTLFRYTELYYIAEMNRNSLHCRAITNPNTLFRYSQH